jgi:hypothetical protein
MNRLEQFIRNHKSRFDEEPATGHFERLQQKMIRKSKRVAALRWNISIAASFALVFLTGIVWNYSGEQDDRMALCENAADMRVCYLNRMNTVAMQIEMLIKDFNAWDQQQVMNEVQNVIDTAGSGFEYELPEELPENEAKQILSGYYRQNLESLEMIAEELRIMNYKL